jgi:hypothetical protein
MRTIVLALSLVNLAAPSLPAQVAPAPSANLSGHVICTDTNAPARFAAVVLRQVGPATTFNDAFEELIRERTAAQNGQPPPPQELEGMRQKARRLIRGFDMDAGATVNADGLYTFKSVMPGTYYVRALMSGYADPFMSFSSADFSSTDPAILARIAQAAPIVTINGTESARIDLRIERGAAIAGRILYDDGAPAQNWGIVVRKPGKLNGPPTSPVEYLSARTDDLGRFRLAGLPAGEYDLMASYENDINYGNRTPDGHSSEHFSIGTKAQAITLTVGEERTGVDFTVPLHNLHRISGRVLAKSDSRPATYGTLLLFTADPAEVVNSAAILSDGSFTIDFVPGSTTYTLKVDRAVETKSTPRADGTTSQSEHVFGSTSTQVILRDSDADNIILAVPESSGIPAK